jgi:protein-S-isoprenylcysteine O-methyltransferase Ste14
MAAMPQGKSLADLVEDSIGNVQDLVRSEIRLAAAEFREAAQKAWRAAIPLVIGAALGFYAAGLLLLSGVYALAQVVPPWLAALLVALATGAVAALFIAAGRKRMQQIDPKPRKTIQSAKETVQWAKHQLK